MKTKLLANDKGNVLAFTMIVIFALVAIAAPFFAVGLIELNISQNQTYRIQAFYLADAGVNYGNELLRATDGNFSGETIGSSTTTSTQYVSYNGQTVGSYYAKVKLIQSNGLINAWQIVGFGTPSNTYSQASILSVSETAFFNDYLVFRDTMSDPFGTGYLANGPMYIGSDIITDGTPEFEGPVTVHGTLDNEGGTPSFLGGVSYNAPVLAANSTFSIGSVFSIASSSGFTDGHYGGGTTNYTAATVTFDNTSAVITLVGPTNGQTTTLYYTLSTTTAGSIIALRPVVYVSGTVNAQVNLVSDSTITITNNLVYANTTLQSTNILGLMTKAWVQIADTVPTNLTVDAAIYAMNSTNGVFEAGPALGVPLGTLTLNGSYATYSNGSFESGSDGFVERDFNFDTRFLYMSPPDFFAVDSEFNKVYWKNAYFL
jgi:hypothetical protein